MERKGLAVVFVLAAAIRLSIFSSAEFREAIAARVEVTTAVTSLTRIREGVFLLERGASPYAGDMLHQPPLLLYLMHPLCHAPVWLLAGVWTVLDLLCALLLWRVASLYAETDEARDDCCLDGASEEEEAEEEQDVKDAAEALAREAKHGADDASLCSEQGRLHTPDLVAAAFLLNPLSVVACVAMSTQAVDHLLLALLLLLSLTGRWVGATLSLALAASLSPYHLALLPPIALILQRSASLHPAVTTGVAAFWAAAVLGVSRGLMGDWDFLRGVYGFVLSVPDLAPNVGLFWYFFVEIFDHFKPFFLFIFQYHIAVYPLPLTMRFQHRPLFAAVMLLGIASVFKSYPSVADPAFYAPLLITFRAHLSGMRNLFELGQVVLFVSVLAPLFWHLWLVSGVGNANFYYALTLAYAISQVMILSEALLATARNDRRARARLRAARK